MATRCGRLVFGVSSAPVFSPDEEGGVVTMNTSMRPHRRGGTGMGIPRAAAAGRWSRRPEPRRAPRLGREHSGPSPPRAFSLRAARIRAATRVTSLSPRPERLTSRTLSGDMAGAILMAWARVCAVFSAGITPSWRDREKRASGASRSVTLTYSARQKPDHAARAIHGCFPMPRVSVSFQGESAPETCRA